MGNTLKKEIEIFVGPCSKFVSGQGWVTEIPVEQIMMKGYQKGEVEKLAEQKAEIERLTECLKDLDWYKMWHKKFKKEIEDLTLELETYRPTKLKGNGQCKCSNCGFVHWTDWCSRYKGKTLCDECLKEIIGTEEKEQAIKDTAKEILQELYDKIEKGTLIKLPCKVGDTIYLPWQYDGVRAIAYLTITHIILDSEKSYIKTNFETDIEDYWKKYKGGQYDFNDFGKIVFTDKTEAEKRLKELQE